MSTNSESVKNDATRLYEAIIERDLSEVKRLLLDVGVDVNAKENERLLCQE